MKRSSWVAPARMSAIGVLCLSLSAALVPAPAQAIPTVKGQVQARAVTVGAPSAAAARATRARILAVAASKRGAPYRYGAAGPRAFDCSGYTSWVFRKVGRRLPRTAQAQYVATRKLPRRQARPGDLVFFGGSYKHHVGIYAGGNRMWHSPRTGRSVTLAKIYSSRVSFGRVR